MLKLPNVTLVTVTSSRNSFGAKRALKYSMREIEFGDVLYISDTTPKLLPGSITYKKMSDFKTIDDFNYFMVYDLYKYISTDFALIIHYDGFVVHPESWRDEFLKYDYIGSPWPLPDENDKISFRDVNGNICRVGNSVSIRSKRLMALPSKLKLPWNKYSGWFNEDGFICVHNKHIFEENGMKFAPFETAIYFGHETMMPEIEDIKPFVFHKWAGTNAKYPNKLYYNYIQLKEKIKKYVSK